MKLGRVVGKVWATAKDDQLNSVRLALMQPVDEHEKPAGKIVVAADTINCRDGDIVYWVGGSEATSPYHDRRIPSDVTIIGLVDKLNT